MDAFTMARAEGTMTAGHGLGMLALGMIAILIGAIIIYKITNREETNDD